MEKVFGEGVAELVERPNVGGQWVEVREPYVAPLPRRERAHVPHVRR